MIIVINGPLGIGKTEVSWHLVEKFNPGVMLDGDYIAALHPFDYSNAAQLNYACDTFRVLVSHHIAHAIQDFIINWVFETPAQLARLCHLFQDRNMPILAYRLVCSMDEIERRVRKRGLPQVETEVQRARELVGILDSAAVTGYLGHVVDTTTLTSTAVADIIWQHAQTNR
jgi:deoxyadenosine/deoxycytidine kinase